MSLDHAALRAAIRRWVLEAGVRGPAVDDVTQEVCIKVFQWIADGKVHSGKEFAFSRRVARNKALDHHRMRTRRKEEPWPDAPSVDGGEDRRLPETALLPDESVEEEGRRKEEEEEALYRAMAKLKPRYRELLDSVYMQHRSYRELAASDVRQRIERGQLGSGCDHDEEERLAYERISMTTRRARKALAALILEGERV